MSARGIRTEGIDMSFTRNGATHQVLANINVDIPAGGFVSLLGPSGCGKTTLLKILAGIQEPSSGSVSIGGSNVGEAVRNGQVGLIQQKAALLPWKTALKNTTFLIEMAGSAQAKKEAEARAISVLKLVGLDGAHEKLPHELSGGMAQRVSIARALALDPAILFMDEPFGALDAITRDQMNDSLQAIWSETKKTVVFVTHSITEAIYLSDRVHVMSGNPGGISLTVDIDLPRPRSTEVLASPEFSHFEQLLRAELDHNVEESRKIA